MLGSKDRSDVRQSAEVCKKAIDFHERRTRKLKSSQLSSAGVHHFEWAHVTRSKEAADQWKVAAEKMIDVRHEFGSTDVPNAPAGCIFATACVELSVVPISRQTWASSTRDTRHRVSLQYPMRKEIRAYPKTSSHGKVDI